MTLTCRRLGVFVACLAVLAVTSCNRIQPTREALVQESKVADIWAKNVRILESVLDGETFKQEAFAQAIAFFEESTGIASRDGRTFVGRIPNQNLEEDLARWQAWYVDNKPFLYWDPSKERIRVDEDAKGSQEQG